MTHHTFKVFRLYIVLRGASRDLKKAMLSAKEHHITQQAFVDSMTGGTYLEQIDAISHKYEDDHVYYAVALFGAWDTVSLITKRLSLYS